MGSIEDDLPQKSPKSQNGNMDIVNVTADTVQLGLNIVSFISLIVSYNMVVNGIMLGGMITLSYKSVFNPDTNEKQRKMDKILLAIGLICIVAILTCACNSTLPLKNAIISIVKLASTCAVYRSAVIAKYDLDNLH